MEVGRYDDNSISDYPAGMRACLSACNPCSDAQRAYELKIFIDLVSVRCDSADLCDISAGYPFLHTIDGNLLGYECRVLYRCMFPDIDCAVADIDCIRTVRTDSDACADTGNLGKKSTGSRRKSRTDGE